AHVTKSEAGELELIKDEEKKAQTAISMQEVNFVSPDTQRLLRTKKVSRFRYGKRIKALNKDQKPEAAVTQDADGDVILAETARDDPAPVPRPSPIQLHEPTSLDGIDTSRNRYLEKNRFSWTGETYFAPLMAAGSLSFRRFCVDYGADITVVIGEKISLRDGLRSAGCESKPNTLVPTAEVLYEECTKNGGIDLLWMPD
ncbi:trna-dihydrouridine synthase 3-like, partial [Moniliophthora roreri MCA 2997]